MNNMILFLWTLLYSAMAEPIQVRVALDDRQYERLNNPMVKVDNVPGVFMDNGVYAGDVPNDGIYVSQLQVERSESFIIIISDADGVAGSIEVSVPSISEATFQLKVSESGVVLDAKAPIMPSDPSPQSTRSSQPMLQAAPRGEAIGPKEELILSLFLDDSLSKSLSNPALRLDEMGAESVSFLDDGENGDETENDHVFLAQLPLLYDKFVQVILLDGETEVVAMTVFLPQNSEAVVRVKKDDDGFHMMTKSQTDQKELIVQAEKINGKDPPNGEIAVLVSLDARLRTVSNPVVKIIGSMESQPMLDDGAVETDTAQDNVYYIRLLLTPSEFLSLLISDGEDSLGLVKIAIPSVEISGVELQYTRFGLSAKGTDDSSLSGEKSQLILQAAPQGVDVSAGSGDDKISLTIYLDDRTLQRLSTPTLKLNQKGFEPVGFRDDGENGDENGDDHLFISKTVIERDEFVQMMIIDGEDKIGQLTIFLPSTSEAVVRVRTSENGIKMMTEPQSTQGTTAPGGGGTTSTSVAVSSDALAHVLWVAIALFALAFAYIRNVVYHYWTEEIQPLLARLESFLEKQEKGDDS